MKTVFLLSTLFPAGLLAAFLGSSAAQQEESAEATSGTVRRVRVVQSSEPADAIEIRGEALAPLAPIPNAPMIVRAIQSTRGPGAWAAQAKGFPAGVSSPHPQTAFAFSIGSDASSESTHKAVAKLRTAKSDEDKAEAREELQAALGEEFDEFLEHQSDELDRMEKKLNNLREQLDKRRDAKGDLISLRLKTLENEVNGLGWPSGGGGNSLFSPLGGAAGQTFDTNLSFTVPAGVVAPAMIATPADPPAVAPPEQPDDDADAETEEPSEKKPPRSRRGAR